MDERSPIQIESKTVRDRDLVSGSTKTRSLYLLCQWLTDTKHMRVIGRVFKGRPHKNVSTRYSSEDTSAASFFYSSEYKELIHLGSYNYSGLNGHPKIIKAAQSALSEYGLSTSGVRLLNGTTELHIEFERRLANFLGFEDVVTYSSGYAANLSVLSALCSDKDIVFSDELNHQSIVDGLKLSATNIIKFPHRNYDALMGILEGAPKLQRKFIVTDGIFSMDGDVADLDKIVMLAKEYNCFVIVDDAHATAAYGPNGRGTPAHYNLQNEIDVLTGSLSKGLPGIGGFAAGSKKTTNLFRFGSNGYIFSASIPAPIIAGLLAALDILENEPEIQNILHQNERYLRDGIRAIGLDVMHSESPIIPISLPNRDIAFTFAKLLHEQGVYANPVCFPAVSRHCPRLRLNASAALTKNDMDNALDALDKISHQLNLI